MKTFTLTLDEYEISNLRWALAKINNEREFNSLDTGDWVNQIKFQLDELETTFIPNGEK